MNQTFLNEQLKKASELQVKGDFKKAKKIYTSLISKAPLNFNLLRLSFIRNSVFVFFS